MLKKDVESSLCIYDKAIRSLPLHTSTQRCDRCTCTHAHTHTNTAIQSLFFLAVSSHTYSDIQSLHKHTNLHSETIAAAIKSPLKHDCRCKHASVFFSKQITTEVQISGVCSRNGVTKKNGFFGFYSISSFHNVQIKQKMTLLSSLPSLVLYNFFTSLMLELITKCVLCMFVC